jgi:penicillin-binding protein 2
VQQLQLDPRGVAVGQLRTVAFEQGDSLVTSLDLDVQSAAERALIDQITRSRSAGKPATGGAVVVMDPNTGRLLAVASYPTYNPELFVRGVSDSDLARLSDPSAHQPLIGRAIAGAYAPGSTFKLITSSSIVSHAEANLEQRYPCPGSLAVDGRVKTNFDSESPGYPLTLRQALQVSCDTWFYAFAANEYYADQAQIDAGGSATEFLQHMASSYGIASSPGVDLPASEQASGSYADRENRLARWKANRTRYCADAKTGFPDEPDPAQRAYLTKLAAENCTDGWRYRAGDNADMAIGQGETTLSPLQLAVAYSAMINGGKVWRPTLGWGVVGGSGQLVRTISPTVKSRLPVSHSVLDYIANALQFTSSHAVSGALAFDGAPYKQLLGGKTGTAEAFGRQDTSWLASWGPVSRDAAGHPRARFVVVGMIEEGGTGASAAAPMVREVYDQILTPAGASRSADDHFPTVPPRVQVVTSTPPTPHPAPSQPSQPTSPSAVPGPAARVGAPR